MTTKKGELMTNKRLASIVSLGLVMASLPSASFAIVAEVAGEQKQSTPTRITDLKPGLTSTFRVSNHNDLFSAAIDPQGALKNADISSHELLALALNAPSREMFEHGEGLDVSWNPIQRSFRFAQSGQELHSIRFNGAPANRQHFFHEATAMEYEKQIAQARSEGNYQALQEILAKIYAYRQDGRIPAITEQGLRIKSSPSLEAYRRFQEKDFWGQTAGATREEILRLRALYPRKGISRFFPFIRNKGLERHLREEGDNIMARIREHLGVSNIGFHYNMHGGSAESYIGSGILTNRDDTRRGKDAVTHDFRPKVFFFHSPGESLYKILDTKHMDIWPISSRMGALLVLFDLDSPEITDGLAAGKIALHTRFSSDMSFVFPNLPVGTTGIPYSAFLAPPLDMFDGVIFNGIAKRIGFKGRLTRQETTLAVMRYLEAALLSNERFVP